MEMFLSGDVANELKWYPLRIWQIVKLHLHAISNEIGIKNNPVLAGKCAGNNGQAPSRYQTRAPLLCRFEMSGLIGGKHIF